MITLLHRTGSTRPSLRPWAVPFFLITVLMLTSILSTACATGKSPVLTGFYQSEPTDGYVIQLTIDKENGRFVQYIDNRQVDSGTFSAGEDNSYDFAGDRQTFTAVLTKDNTLTLTVGAVNGGGPILLSNVSDTPSYFTTQFDDVNAYIKLLEP